MLYAQPGEHVNKTQQPELWHLESETRITQIQETINLKQVSRKIKQRNQLHKTNSKYFNTVS